MSGQDKFKNYCNTLKEKISNENVLLVKVPQINFNIFEEKLAKNKGYQVYSPTGLQYLSQALHGRGLNINILDMNYEVLRRINFDSFFKVDQWMGILEESLNKYNPSFVGVSNIFRMEQENFFKVLEYLKTKEKDSIVFTGGQNATYIKEKLLERELCHFVCVREGENKINYLFDQFLKGENTNPIPEIFFKPNKEILSTGEGPDIVELEGNLIEEHKKLPIEDYVKVGTLGPFSRMAGEDVPFAPIVFNRGCRANCSFCTVRDYMGKGVRSRKIEDVLNEMSYLYFDKGIKHFEFLDDDITRYKDRLSKLLEEIPKRKIDITWSAQNGIIAYNCDAELLEKMRDSHCFGFKVGVESGNQERLRSIRKPGKVESFRKFAERAQKIPELFMSFNYILGFPGEAFSETMDTFNFSRELNSDWASYSIYIPLGAESKEEDKDENFIPSKSSEKMEIAGKKVLEGYDIFKLPLDEIPSRDQLKEIWFSFNMQGNFIENKNLSPVANPEKFIKWMTVLQKTYSLNADMPFFLSLAYQLVGNREQAQIYYGKTLENFDGYWKKRFRQFNLTGILENFPSNPEDTRKCLDNLLTSSLEHI